MVIAMQSKTVLRAALPAIACAVAFCAAEVWNTKDSRIWTEAEANLILNNSPWAKQVKTKSAQSGGAQPGGRRGGGMGRRGGMGGPGSYPRGGGGGRGGEANAPMSAVVRWESAKPVQEAEARLKKLSNSENSRAGDKSSANPFENHYVVSVIGLRPEGRQGGRNQGDEADGGGSRQMRDQLMTYTQLVLKNKAPMGPDDIKVNTQGGASEIQFFFPKTSPITPDDKEVTFQTTIGRMKLENKFDLKKMTRNKKLEID
jgi:hypothetical protein